MVRLCHTGTRPSPGQARGKYPGQLLAAWEAVAPSLLNWVEGLAMIAWQGEAPEILSLLILSLLIYSLSLHKRLLSSQSEGEGRKGAEANSGGAGRALLQTDSLSALRPSREQHLHFYKM